MPRRSDADPKALAEDREAALRLVPLSDMEQQRSADAIKTCCCAGSGMLNLVVARPPSPKLWTRHIADSAQLRDLAPSALRWADFGSGGGFPGMVIALLLAEAPGAEIHLIESDKRKAAFLRAVSRETGAAAVVHAASGSRRFVPPLRDIEIVTSRATAPLMQLIELAVMRFFRAGRPGSSSKAAAFSRRSIHFPKRGASTYPPAEPHRPFRANRFSEISERSNPLIPGELS